MVEKNTDCEWETVNNTGEDQRDDVTEEKWEIKKKSISILKEDEYSG